MQSALYASKKLLNIWVQGANRAQNSLWNRPLLDKVQALNLNFLLLDLYFPVYEDMTSCFELKLYTQIASPPGKTSYQTKPKQTIAVKNKAFYGVWAQPKPHLTVAQVQYRNDLNTGPPTPDIWNPDFLLPGSCSDLNTGPFKYLTISNLLNVVQYSDHYCTSKKIKL